MKKTYVKVVVEFSEEGNKVPKSIHWQNGKVYDIDKVIDVKNRPSMKVGGIGERYEVKVMGTTTYLFFEQGKWFVEEK